MDEDMYRELEQALTDVKVQADAESSVLMLTTYRGAIDAIRRGVIVGASHDPDKWQGFLEAVSLICDALEPMESVFWDIRMEGA